MANRTHKVDCNIGENEGVIAAALHIQDGLAVSVWEKYFHGPAQRGILCVVVATLPKIVEPHGVQLPILGQ